MAMDRDNLWYQEDLAGGPQAHIRLLGSFLPERQDEPGQAPEVPDPYYGGSQGFEDVLDMLERACPGIHSACRESSGKLGPRFIPPSVSPAPRRRARR